jgi:acetyl esterase/lipase
MVSRESREYLRKLRKNPAFGEAGNEFDLEGLRQGMGTRQLPADIHVRCLPSRIGDLPCEWVLAPGADPDLRLLYLHGGGYVAGSGAHYLPLAGLLSAAAKCAVLLPDYRLAPENRFPAGLEDCILAYRWMIGSGPYGPAPASASFIAGDSAGGGLTLSTLLALRDRGAQLPAGGIPLSACTDLTLSGESLRWVEDPICSARAMPAFADLYLGDQDPRNPLASPLFGDYTGIPPLLIQVGELEMLRDDSVRLAARARADGVDARLEVWPGMVHVFQIRGLPESREAVEGIAGFMRSCLAR